MSEKKSPKKNKVQTATPKYPFSPALEIGDTVYVSGNLGIDLKTGTAPSDPMAEARLMMENFKAAVDGAGLVMDDLVSVEIFCTDLSLFASFNELYSGYFTAPFPTRAFIGAKKLLFKCHFEISGVAVRSAAKTKKSV